jgi:hypothetical protein
MERPTSARIWRATTRRCRRSPTALHDLCEEQMGAAEQLEAFYEEFRLGLERLRYLFAAASVLLVLEILAWVVDLASRD